MEQPLLQVSQRNDDFIVVGPFILTDNINDAGPFDSYNVGIVVSSDYPETAPSVYELGERIPHKVDRHMFNSSACCVTVFSAWKEQNSDHSFRKYLSGPIRDFFLSQSHFEETDKWPFGEYEHGDIGIAQACSEVFQMTLSPDDAKRYLKYAALDRPKGHLQCPCGSGLIIRKCCGISKLETVRSRCSKTSALRLLRQLS